MNTERAIKKGYSWKTGNIVYTRRRKTKEKHNTTCVWHTIRKQTHITVNKGCAHLQTTGDQDEPIIVSMLKSQLTSKHRTQSTHTHIIEQESGL